MKSTLVLIKNLIMLKPTAASLIENIVNIVLGRSSRRLILRDGIEVYAPGNHPLIEMTSEIFYQNSYSSNNLFFDGNGIVIDIGANIGIFSLLAARETKNLVYAFEPDPQNVYLLKKNLGANNIKNVVVSEIAVCDDIGHKELYLNSHPGGHSLFRQTKGNPRQKCLSVATTTLRDIIDTNHLTAINFLKIDCEGSEGVILQSTTIDYLQKINQIALEFHDNVSTLTHCQIQDLLHQAGFVTQLKWDCQGPFGFIYASQKR